MTKYGTHFCAHVRCHKLATVRVALPVATPDAPALVNFFCDEHAGYACTMFRDARATKL